MDNFLERFVILESKFENYIKSKVHHRSLLKNTDQQKIQTYYCFVSLFKNFK